MLEPVVLTPLPCGELVDKAAGGWCLIDCPNPTIRDVTPMKAKCVAVEACEHWKGQSVLRYPAPETELSRARPGLRVGRKP